MGPARDAVHRMERRGGVFTLATLSIGARPGPSTDVRAQSYRRGPDQRSPIPERHWLDSYASGELDSCSGLEFGVGRSEELFTKAQRDRSPHKR